MGYTGDRDSLPYTEATVLEISRLASVLPIAPPRQVSSLLYTEATVPVISRLASVLLI